MEELNMKDISDLKRLKEALDHAIDRRIENLRMDECIESVKAMPFGKLKNIFENISGRLFETAEGKKAIKEYVTAIKCSKPLTCFHGVFESVCKGVTANASIHAREAVNMLENAGRPDAKSMKSLREAVCSGIRAAGLTSAEFGEICGRYDESVMKAIDSLTEIKGRDLTKRVAVLNEIADFLEKNGTADVHESGEGEDVSIEQLSEILSGQYDGWEKDALTEISVGIMAGKSKKDVFEESREKCIGMLREAIEEADDESEKARLNEMAERLEKKEYCEETANDDIFRLSELKSMI